MSEEQKPSLIDEVVEGLHNLEQKVENIIHPADAAPSSSEPVQEAGGASVGEMESHGADSAGASSGSVDAGANNADSTGNDAGNVAASAAANTSLIESASSALPASLAGPAAVIGTYVSDQIKARLASIKQQLDIHHFEQSVVAGIHAELDAIEGLL